MFKMVHLSAVACALSVMLHGAHSMKIVGLAYPLHASCIVQWKWSGSCSDVRGKIVEQIKKWTGPDNCKDGGEKCLYELKSSSGANVTATHTTPVKKYVDDLTFIFTQDASDGCKVEGKSRSETWYAFLDYGTNYCNLENLITGSGLDKAAGYSESTDDSKCTQYSSANCEKY